MSDLKYINGPDPCEKHSDIGHYSQAVVIGNIGKFSGQGGWDSEGNVEKYDWKQQVEQAFLNVDKVLQAAGFRGWEDVYLLRSYQTDISNQWDYLKETLKKRIPGHRPLLTALSVPALAFPGMTIELEVEAIRQGKAD